MHLLHYGGYISTCTLKNLLLHASQSGIRLGSLRAGVMLSFRPSMLPLNLCFFLIQREERRSQRAAKPSAVGMKVDRRHEDPQQFSPEATTEATLAAINSVSEVSV